MTSAEEKVRAMEFIAPIVEAQMRFDQSMTNRLMEDAWGAAELWATRFKALVESIERSNDSIRVARVIDRHWQPDISRQIDHYKQMGGKDAGSAY